MQLYLQNLNKITDPELLQVIEEYKQKYILPLNMKANRMLLITPTLEDVNDIESISSICKLVKDGFIAIVCLCISKLHYSLNSVTPYAVQSIDNSIIPKEGRQLISAWRNKLVKENLFTEISTTVYDVVVFGQLNSGLIYTA